MTEDDTFKVLRRPTIKDMIAIVNRDVADNMPDWGLSNLASVLNKHGWSIDKYSAALDEFIERSR